MEPANTFLLGSKLMLGTRCWIDAWLVPYKQYDITPCRVCRVLLHLQLDLARAMYLKKVEPGQGMKDFVGKSMFSLASRVVGVGSDWVKLERPLPVEVPLVVKPALRM